jgi:ATP-dependent DNA ligase
MAYDAPPAELVNKKMKLFTINPHLVYWPVRILTKISPALEQKYGPDFRHKLQRYRTAQLNGQCVAICEVDPNTLDALIKDTSGRHINCSVNDLDNFVLMTRVQIVPGLSAPFFPMRPRSAFSLTSSERIEMIMQRIQNGDTVQKKLNGDRAVLVSMPRMWPEGQTTLFNRHGTDYSHAVSNISDFGGPSFKFGLSVFDGEVWHSKFYPFEAIVMNGTSLVEKSPAVREEAAIQACKIVGLEWTYALDRNWLYGELRQKHTLRSQWEGVVIKAKDSPYRVLGTETQDSDTWFKWKFEVIRA